FQQAFASSKDEIGIDRLDVKLPQGGSLPVRVDGSRLRLGGNDAWVIVLTDITKELQTRSVIEHEVTVRTQQLNEARAYLLSSINSLEQGFMLVNRHGAIEVINNVATRFFKLSAAVANNTPLTEATKQATWNVDLAGQVQKVLESRHHR